MAESEEQGEREDGCEFHVGLSRADLVFRLDGVLYAYKREAMFVYNWLRWFMSV